MESRSLTANEVFPKGNRRFKSSRLRLVESSCLMIHMRFFSTQIGVAFMKKISIFLVSLLVLGLANPVAHAVTEGCPETWKIDTTSRAGYEELLQEKARLGADLALSQPVTKYVNYSGELGTLAAPKDGGQLTLEDVYLYGKTQVQLQVGVQKKNCPGITTFVINVGTLSDSFGVKSIHTNIDPQVWANANENFFIDFTKPAKFGACINLPLVTSAKQDDTWLPPAM